MTTRQAGCRCGALTVRCSGEPVRVSVCHCMACKQRTGSAFAWNVTFSEQAVEISGESSIFTRTTDSNLWARDHFCPACGSTVYYAIEARRGMISVPAGNFRDAELPEPDFSIYEERKAPWVELHTRGPLERMD